ncbi:hypothetical protein TNCV_1013031 [Trichonephila clavipes]|uniref:Uncharacterized protein n=1 Tax=Trichonephila clavipes TaxID=2585209 RepID=A0A8X6VXH0_TRICX|nr:hypothetical protein TNCV_1013031 [Trichonephila clavipes]
MRHKEIRTENFLSHPNRQRSGSYLEILTILIHWIADYLSVQLEVEEIDDLSESMTSDFGAEIDNKTPIKTVTFSNFSALIGNCENLPYAAGCKQRRLACKKSKELLRDWSLVRKGPHRLKLLAFVHNLCFKSAFLKLWGVPP